MTARTYLALLLVMALVPLHAVEAKLYKWVDKDGNVTYSQQKPAHVKAQTIKLRGVQSVSGEQAKERLNVIEDKAATARKDREFQATTSSESKQRETRMKKNCETARQNLRVLKAGVRVKSTDPNAGGGYLSAEQRAQQLETAKNNIKDNCN